MKNPPENRSPLAVAYQLSTRVMTVALEMVLPGLAGWWLDRRLGTVLALTIIGFGLGMGLGMWHLIRMAGADRAAEGRGRTRDP